MILQNTPRVNKIKFGIAFLAYILTVIWIGNFWLLLGLPIIYDIYISRKIPWSLKKNKDGKKPSIIVEWIDALVFALVAVYMINLFLFQNYKIPTSSLEKTMLVGDHLFVSKVAYGPRMPITPISFPLVQNTFPITNTKSYTDWPKWDYKRLKGFGKVERDDIVVFNFPTGDTVALYRTNPDYYITIRELGNSQLSQNPSLLKGKKFESEYEMRMFVNELGRKIIKNNPINGEAVENPKEIQHNYHLITDGTRLNKRFYNRLGISEDDRMEGGMGPHYVLPLTEEMAESIKEFPFIKSLEKIVSKNSSSSPQVFPYSQYYNWSRDNYGPILMPEKGASVELTIENLLLYERIITAYEGNSLEVKDNTIYINGKPTTSYTFKMNYYFMLGDNRHKSADSRYWGFVPEDHIVGRPVLVWLSLDKDKSFPRNIRWNRFFKFVKNN